MLNKKVYTLGAASIGINILVLSIDTIPYLAPKIKEKFFPSRTIKVDSSSNSEDLIVKSAIGMLKSKKTVTIWDEENGFTREIIKKLKKIKTKQSRKDQLNHYPRAFLYYGLTEYTIKKERLVILNEVKEEFDSFIDFQDDLQRIDQVPFGLAALNLYEIYGDDKYLEFAGKIFNFILSQMDRNGLVSYRKNQVITFPDTLGLIVPFLLKYRKYSDRDTTSIARDQMSYFIKFGVNKISYMPVHGVNRDNNIQVGSANWGRGIGWYFMALSYFYKDTGEYENEYYGLIETLSKLKNQQGLWGQFPGSKDKFDASSTTMFLYSIIVNNLNKFSSNDIFKIFEGFISNEGIVLETSGDTYSLNSYSSRFGKSELSQGVLLLMLSEIG